MSDELMDLEGEATSEPETAALPPESQSATPPVQGQDPRAAESPDVEVEGQKFVPLQALLKEREGKKEIQDKISALEQQLAAQKPLIEFLNQHPVLTQPPAPTAPVGHTEDVEAQEVAAELYFYKPDGSLDVERGRKHLDRIERRAEQIADKRIQPLLQTSHQQQADVNFQRIAGNTKGLHPDALRAVFAQVPVEVSADPQNAALLGLVALGLQSAMGRGPAQAAPAQTPPPVVMTEPSGGTPVGRPPVTDFGRRMAADRGRSEKEWAANAKGFMPGRSSAVED